MPIKPVKKVLEELFSTLLGEKIDLIGAVEQIRPYMQNKWLQHFDAV